MAKSTAAIGAGNMDVNRTATFIPEWWSSEILASFERKNVMMDLVQKHSFVGKKGDVVHIPVPGRGQATLKAPRAQVNVQYETTGELTIVVDKHYEYSASIEDIVTKQALPSYRKHLTKDAGYQLSQQIDRDLIQLGRFANNGAGTNVYAEGFIGGDGTTAYNGSNQTTLSDAAIRRTIQRLDDNDIPTDERYMLIPPAAKNTLLGLARFTEQAFVGEQGSGNSIRNGRVGDIYGMDVYVSPNADTTSGGHRVVLIAHKDAFALAMQSEIRTQSQYRLDYLADLMVSDVLYGVKAVRVGASAQPELLSAAYALVVPA